MADRIGQQLGNYRLVRLLGRGGFAQVYLGEHLHLGTQAAIKVLHLTLESDDVEHFRTEARTIARLMHPHIVRVLDFGLEGLTPFLVMDYAPHGTLRQRHPKGICLPLETVRSYATQVAAALQYAHHHKVIHRDIKPENMLLGQHSEVFLSDFGLAVVASSSPQPILQEVVGTTSYIAPEQLQGKPCIASDQYALGVVVYEWLCGTLPFYGSPLELALQHLRASPPPLREKVPALSPGVEQVVLTALAKDPGQRFASIEAFATALERAILSERSDPGEPQMPSPTTLSRGSLHIGRSQQRPLVGRDQEREILRHLLLETEQAKHLSLADHKSPAVLLRPMPSCSPFVLFLGEAGIGKTRLAEEVSREAQQRGWAVVWGRVHAQESTIAYQLWIEALRSAMTQGHWPEQEMSQHPMLYQPLTTLLPELADLLPQRVVLSGVTPEQVQLRIWEAMLALLTAISERTPLLAVLDDLHWADGSSSALLGYLVRRLPGHRVLLMGTCRQTELPSMHPLRSLLADLQREWAVTTLHVPALTDAQIGTLVAHLPESLVQRIQNQAAGNPFFAEELARVSCMEGMTSSDEASPPTKYHEPALPETIAAVLDLRLGRLSRACRQFLSNAAVLGDSFSFATIRLMEISRSPSLDEDSVLDLLEEALQAGILTEEGSGARISYDFWHPLLVGHLYNSLSAVRRTSLHRRAAEVLRQMSQGQEEEKAASITYHLVKGGAEATYIARYAEHAGNRAYSLSAYPDAERYYRLAVEHLGRSVQQSTDASTDEQIHLASLLEFLGECTRHQGKYEEARHIYEQALEMCKQQPLLPSSAVTHQEAQIQAMLWCEVGYTWYDVGNNIQALQCYKHAERVLQDAHITGGPAWATIRLQQSYVSWREGNYEKARQNAQEALQLFEGVLAQQGPGSQRLPHSTRVRRILAGDPVDLGRTHALLGLIATGAGQPTEATMHWNSALATFEQYECQREIAVVCCNLGDVHLRRAEYNQAQAFLRRSLGIAERIGELPLVCIVFANMGLQAMRTGELAEAENWFKQGLALAEQINEPVHISLLYTCLSLVLQDQGKPEEADKCLLKALSISRSMAIAPCIGFALIVLGSMRIAQAMMLDVETESSMGAREGRTRVLQRAKRTLLRALLIEGMDSETRTEGQLVLAHVSLLLGELETARHQAVQAMNEARRSEQTSLIARSQRLLGSILAAQGQRDQADIYFEQAIQVFHDRGMRLEWARALQSYGVALLQRDGAGVASYQQGLSYLQEARQAFHQCNAVLDLQAVERVLDPQNGTEKGVS